MSALYYYEPSYTFDRLFDQLYAARDVSQNRGPNETSNSEIEIFKPRTKNPTVTATFELPGLRREDVIIDVHDGRLTVSAETKIVFEDEQNGYAVRERRFGKLSRTLRLPQGVRDEDIKASLEDGLLTVTFPKSIPESASRRISIASFMCLDTKT